MSGKPGMKRPRVRQRNDREYLIAEPTENQIDEAMAAFELSKLRHQLLKVGNQVAVRILPDAMLPTVEFMGVKVPPLHEGAVAPDIAFTVKYFADELSARQWREREIIREAITKGLRTKP